MESRLNEERKQHEIEIQKIREKYNIERTLLEERIRKEVKEAQDIELADLKAQLEEKNKTIARSTTTITLRRCI